MAEGVMRVVGAASFCLLGVLFAACATGTASDDTTLTDSGTKTDSSLKDSSPPKDGAPAKDTGGPIDTGVDAPPCGGQCLGLASTCCNNVCVDVTSDPNNCGGCGNPSCGTSSCCAGNCTDTMGSDNSNCGGCGIPCSGTCMNGVCQTNNSGCTIDMGTCAHSPCTTGSALNANCDSNAEGIVLLVCFYDPTCCTTTWDATCKSWATLFETNSCSGGGC